MNDKLIAMKSKLKDFLNYWPVISALIVTIYYLASQCAKLDFCLEHVGDLQKEVQYYRDQQYKENNRLETKLDKLTEIMIQRGKDED